MKKILVILLCFVMCISICGCNGTKIDATAAREALESVINKEQDFTYKSSLHEKVTQENLKNFEFLGKSSLETFYPLYYAFVDFNDDGIEEALVLDARFTYFLILRYDGEKVVGYTPEENIEYQKVKTDGTFLTVTYIFDEDHKIIGENRFLCGIEFDDLDYQIKTLASQDNKEGVYKIGNRTSTKDEVEKYISDWDKDTTKPEWNEINWE